MTQYVEKCRNRDMLDFCALLYTQHRTSLRIWHRMQCERPFFHMNKDHCQICSVLRHKTAKVWCSIVKFINHKKLTSISPTRYFCCTLYSPEQADIRDVTDYESASESNGIWHFLKSEIRRILKIRSQRI